MNGLRVDSGVVKRASTSDQRRLGGGGGGGLNLTPTETCAKMHPNLRGRFLSEDHCSQCYSAPCSPPAPIGGQFIPLQGQKSAAGAPEMTQRAPDFPKANANGIQPAWRGRQHANEIVRAATRVSLDPLQPILDHCGPLSLVWGTPGLKTKIWARHNSVRTSMGYNPHARGGPLLRVS